MNITLKTYLITLGVVVLAFIGFYIYHTITVNNLEEEKIQAQIEASKYEFAYKISDSLWKSYGGTLKFDSLLNTLTDVKEEIKKNNERPILITTVQPTVKIYNIPADTTKPDPLDSTYRTAEAKHPKGYYDLNARYQVISPWKFEFSKIYVPDKLSLTTVKTPENRVAVYVKNWNPFVSVDSVATYIDPIMITNYKEVEKKTWKWISSFNSNFKSLNMNWFDVIDLKSAVYAPFNVGIQFGATYNRNIDKVYTTFGLGYLYNF